MPVEDESGSSNQIGAERGRSPAPRLVATGILALLAVVFILQNTNSGRIKVLFWHFDTPVWLSLLVVFVVGVVIGSVFPWFRRKQA